MDHQDVVRYCEAQSYPAASPKRWRKLFLWEWDRKVLQTSMLSLSSQISRSEMNNPRCMWVSPPSIQHRCMLENNQTLQIIANLGNRRTHFCLGDCCLQKTVVMVANHELNKTAKKSKGHHHMSCWWRETNLGHLSGHNAAAATGDNDRDDHLFPVPRNGRHRSMGAKWVFWFFGTLAIPVVVRLPFLALK